MLYSDFKTIYELSGPVAAALVINEIDDVKFDSIAYDYPDIAHVVAVPNMDSHGIKLLLGRDINWLDKIDTSCLNIYTIRSLLLEHPFLKLNTNCLLGGDWTWLLENANVTQLLAVHQSDIVRKINVIPWATLCLQDNEFRKIYDPEPVMKLLSDKSTPSNYRFYLASLTVGEAMVGHLAKS